MTLFTSQSAAMFYDKLFSSLDFTLPRAATGRRGFPKEAMVCAFIVMKCEGFTQITDLMDYLDNNRLIAHYCGFNIMEPLPSYWTYDRFLRQLNNGALKSIMANLVRKLYELGVVDASFVGLDSTPVMANTKQNNPKSFAKSKFSKENHPKSDPDCALGVHSASNQHNERRYEFYWGYKSHALVDCISGLPLYELTTQANIMDSTVAVDILAAANQILPLQGCSFLADKGYDVKTVYNLVKDAYEGEAVFLVNKLDTKNPEKLSVGNLICEAGFAMSMDGKTTDGGGDSAETLLSLPPTDFPSIGNAYVLSVSMPCLWLLPPFCPVLTPAAHPNHSDKTLKVPSHMAFFARFSSGLAFVRFFSLRSFVLGLVLLIS